VLDATPLSLLCHSQQQKAAVQEINAWLETRLAAGELVCVPKIADYEVRRELLRAGKAGSVRRLDDLIPTLEYLPIDTSTMRRAAELWATARNQGKPTAPPDALDADVIVAAQAERIGGIVATENPAHLSRFVAAMHWRSIQ
jgi:predicted nucleic acid-binding protein